MTPIVGFKEVFQSYDLDLQLLLKSVFQLVYVYLDRNQDIKMRDKPNFE